MRATTTAALLGFLSLSTFLANTAFAAKKPAGDSSTPAKHHRNTSIEACDQPDGTLVTRKNTGKAVAWSSTGLIPIEQSDNPVFYVAPGHGACDFNYTDADPGACINPGWLDGGYYSKCNAWVRVELPALGTKVDVRVLDSCGGGSNPNPTSFGCNDVFLTLSSYTALAQGNKSIIDAGRLPGPVNWHFLKHEPCFGCENGLPGIKPFGEEDKCTGPDDDGVKRNGRKVGPERKFGAAAGEACNGLSGGHLFGVNTNNYVELFTEAAIKNGGKPKGTPPKQQQRSLVDDGHHQVTGSAHLARGHDDVMATNKKRFNLLDKSESFAAKVMRNAAAEEGYEK